MLLTIGGILPKLMTLIKRYPEAEAEVEKGSLGKKHIKKVHSIEPYLFDCHD